MRGNKTFLPETLQLSPYFWAKILQLNLHGFETPLYI